VHDLIFILSLLKIQESGGDSQEANLSARVIALRTTSRAGTDRHKHMEVLMAGSERRERRDEINF
jgi:hypothetical protein